MKDAYAALLLHAAGQPISEDNVKKVLVAAGVNEEPAKVKALVAALEGVNIEDAIKQAAIAAAPAASPAGEAKKEDKKAEVSEEKKEEEAAAGLASLFG